MDDFMTNKNSAPKTEQLMLRMKNIVAANGDVLQTRDKLIWVSRHRSGIGIMAKYHRKCHCSS